MKRVCVVCEGPTEVEFIKSCITPYLLKHAVYAYPAILQAPSGRHRGGRVTVDRLAKFISHQYHEADRITTLVDYYGFQDRAGRTRAGLEQAILDALRHHTPRVDARYVLPYVQMHEFEGLLFSDVEQFQLVLDGWNAKNRAALLHIRQSFGSPEDINDSPETAPSQRILSIFDEGVYSKTEHGPLIAEAIGIDRIRGQCPQFDAWLARLQAWKN
jgi:hypothetical protein